MKGEIKEVYICLDRSLFVKKKLVIFWQKRAKQPIWLIMAFLRQHFLQAKINFLVKINKPKFANVL